MINSLAEYTNLWNLRINLDKSKILVFKNGGRPAKNEKWFLQGNRIEAVNQFKYLGMTLTSGAIFQKHLMEKLAKAKQGLNTIWKSFMENDRINFYSKLKIFNTVSRAIVCYGTFFLLFSFFLLVLNCELSQFLLVGAWPI